MATKQNQNQKPLFTPQSPLLVTTRVKILLTFLVGLVISILVVFLTRQQYLDSLTNRTEILSTMLDASKVQSLIDDDSLSGQSESSIRRQFQQVRGVNDDTQYLYLMAITESNQAYFLADSESSGSNKHAPRGQVYSQADEEFTTAFYTGRSYVQGPLTYSSDSRLSAISPVYNNQGQQIAIIGMDVRPADYFSVLFGAFGIPVLGATLVSAVFLMTDTIRRRRQESVRMRSELVSIASHELRTPLTGIRWGEESLLATKLAKDGRAVLQTMYDSTLRLQESIEDILQLANWQAGRNQELILTTTDLDEMFRGIFATQKLPAAQKNVKLEFASKWPNKLLVNCDAQRMKRVFNNLVSNAIKYSNPHTTIIVAHQKVDGKHLITIQDHGIGIPKPEQDKVFAGFYRATNAVSHEASGTGMGLYMSRNSIELHGGKLWLSSEEGKGTTVYIQIP